MIRNTTSPNSLGETIATALRRPPGDLAALAAFVLLGGLALVALPLPSPVAAVIWFPMLLWAPGFALVSAVYPGRYRGAGVGHSAGATPPWSGSETTRPGDGITRPERAVLSVGMSVLLLPMVAGAVALVAGSLHTDAVVAAVVGTVLLLVPIASARRHSLPESERAPVGGGLRALVGWLFGGSRRQNAANVGLVLAILLAATTMGFAMLVPNDGSAYTTATILAMNDGDWVADGYPSTMTAGTPQVLALQLDNNEGQVTRYAAVVSIERVDTSGDRTTVVDREELAREQLTVDAGSTARMQTTVEPSIVGRSLRLSYYVYLDDAPQTPAAETAYRHLYLWVRVTPAG